MKLGEVTVGKLSGVDLRAFCIMMENGSMLESIQDEFEMSVAGVREQSAAVNDAAYNFGSITNYIAHLEKMGGVRQNSEEATPQKEAPKLNKKPNKRTSEGLRDTLFDTIARLSSGDIEHADALAICAVSMAICRTVQLELDYAKYGGGKDGKGALKPLQLGAVDE